MADLRKSLFTLFSGTLLTFGVWLAIVITIDPNSTDPLTIITFFSSLFLWLTGLCTFILVYIRSHMSEIVQPTIISNSLVHASLIILSIDILLILQTLRVLGILESIIVCILFLLLELYLHTKSS